MTCKFNRRGEKFKFQGVAGFRSYWDIAYIYNKVICSGACHCFRFIEYSNRKYLRIGKGLGWNLEYFGRVCGKDHVMCFDGSESH